MSTNKRHQKKLKTTKTDGLKGIHISQKPREPHLKTGDKIPGRGELLKLKRLGSNLPIPPKHQGLRLLITLIKSDYSHIKLFGRCRQEVYGTSSYTKIPSVKTLQKIGVPFDPKRGDQIIIEEVSPELFSATHYIWVRPLPKKQRKKA